MRPRFQTMLEALTGDIPHKGLNDFAIMRHIGLEGKLPDRPVDVLPPRSRKGDGLWNMLAQCWDVEPTKRPAISEVCEFLNDVTQEDLHTCIGTNGISLELNLGIIPGSNPAAASAAAISNSQNNTNHTTAYASTAAEARAAAGLPVSRLPTFTFGSLPPAPATKTASFNWAAAGLRASAAPAGGAWTCTVCMLSNPATATDRCTVCDAKKSGAASPFNTSSFDW
ncbi:unnamed protein product, partial [Rhizoctonia solani]